MEIFVGLLKVFNVKTLRIQPSPKLKAISPNPTLKAIAPAFRSQEMKNIAAPQDNASSSLSSKNNSFSLLQIKAKTVGDMPVTELFKSTKKNNGTTSFSNNTQATPFFMTGVKPDQMLKYHKTIDPKKCEAARQLHQVQNQGKFSGLIIPNRGSGSHEAFKFAHKANYYPLIRICTKDDENAPDAKLVDKTIYVKDLSNRAEVMFAIEEAISLVPANCNLGLHPVWGYLAEDATFAESCEKNPRLIYIGPSHQAIDKFGSKINSKKAARHAGFDVIDGYEEKSKTQVIKERLNVFKQESDRIGYPVSLKPLDGDDNSDVMILEGAQDWEKVKHLLAKNQCMLEKYNTEQYADYVAPTGYKEKSKKQLIAARLQVFQQECDRIGYPAVLKTEDGGGGTGMMILKDSQDWENASHLLEKSQCLLETFLDHTKHIHLEFPIAVDAEGNVIVMGERECSIQRKGQKFNEEASIGTKNKDRSSLIKPAKAMVKDYKNFGTIELLVDENGVAKFLEMNTRLQVEHGVTELVTGVDAMETQFAIAQGYSFASQFQQKYPNYNTSLSPQENIDILSKTSLNKHAMQVRINAVDISLDGLNGLNFSPVYCESLTRVTLPENGSTVKVLSAIEVGTKVNSFNFNSTQVIIGVKDFTQEGAAKKLLNILKFEVVIEGNGMATNLDFLIAALEYRLNNPGKRIHAGTGDIIANEFANSPVMYEKELARLGLSQDLCLPKEYFEPSRPKF